MEKAPVNLIYLTDITIVGFIMDHGQLPLSLLKLLLQHKILSQETANAIVSTFGKHRVRDRPMSRLYKNFQMLN